MSKRRRQRLLIILLIIAISIAIALPAATQMNGWPSISLTMPDGYAGTLGAAPTLNTTALATSSS